MIQLNGIDLPDDMSWPNELAYTPVVQSLEHAVTGDPVLQFGIQKGGVPSIWSLTVHGSAGNNLTLCEPL